MARAALGWSKRKLGNAGSVSVNTVTRFEGEGVLRATIIEAIQDAFEKAGIPFCLTTADLRDPKQFLTNLRKAFDNGLSEAAALTALTKTPATLIGIYEKVGSLDAGNAITASIRFLMS